MKTTMFVALALVISTGALAEGSPEYNRPFSDGYMRVPAGTGLGNAPTTTDSDAVARLRVDGYRAISELTRASDGSWHGSAVRGAAKLHVHVDAQGRISAR